MKLHLEVRDDNGCTIYAPDVIDIPDGAYELHGHCHKTGDCLPSGAFSFPIPRPKVKVKKYRWAIPKGGKVEITENHYTEKEMESYNKIEPFLFWYHRIDETMVEVEE